MGEFVSEIITPLEGAFDTGAMARGAAEFNSAAWSKSLSVQRGEAIAVRV